MGSISSAKSLIAAARGGDKRAVGRLISSVENDPEAAIEILRLVYADATDVWVTGVTGAPGAGKSTLVNDLVGARLAAGRRVAVLAVDPTSPFTGGALLGDRIRMEQRRAGAVLFRSMATRGWLGGMARSTERVATLCAGLGYDEVFIETVGVGQSEVDVAAAADTTVVVLTPGWGDGVQVAKAGLMEIADVFVVNKADREGVADAVRELHEMLKLGGTTGWQPPVVATVATAATGIVDLVAALDEHRRVVGANPAHRVGERRRRDFRRAVLDRLESAAADHLGTTPGLELESAVIAGETDPWTAAAALIRAAQPD